MFIKVGQKTAVPQARNVKARRGSAGKGNQNIRESRRDGTRVLLRLGETAKIQRVVPDWDSSSRLSVPGTSVAGLSHVVPSALLYIRMAMVGRN